VPLLVVAVITLISLASVPVPGRSLTPACQPSNARAASLVSELRHLMAATDTWTVKERDSIAHVPVVPATEVRLVQDERICREALAAYHRPHAVPRGRAVYVVQLGPHYYAVLDPDQLAGEFQTVRVFTSDWTDIGGWTG